MYPMRNNLPVKPHCTFQTLWPVFFGYNYSYTIPAHLLPPLIYELTKQRKSDAYEISYVWRPADKRGSNALDSTK
jgi:hypothetical protein